MVLSSCFCEGGRPAIYAHSVQPGIKAYSSWLGSKRPPRMLLGLSAYIGYLSSVHLTTPDHSSSYCYCAVRISCVDTTNVSWHNRRVTIYILNAHCHSDAFVRTILAFQGQSLAFLVCVARSPTPEGSLLRPWSHIRSILVGNPSPFFPLRTLE